MTPINDREDDPTENKDEDAKAQSFVIMPFAGRDGEKVISKITKKIPENVRPKIAYTGTNLSTLFSVKDKVKTEHLSNLVYYYQNRRDQDSDYTGKTKGNYRKRIGEHQGRDK